MKVVKGMPFSAKAVTESNQTLADGNRIVRKSIASIARDREGRTRREQNLPNAGLTSCSFKILRQVSTTFWTHAPARPAKSRFPRR